MGLKKNVLETLASTPIRWVNFTFANRMISPICYYLIASKVSEDKIKCELNSSLTNQAQYDATNNKIIASDHSYGETYLEEKALLVHECTHAILDCFYNGRDMNGAKAGAITVLADETIAYIAQAIYLIASKGPSPSNQGDPDYKAVESVRSKVEAMMAHAWTGCETMSFTAAEVAGLQTAIKRNALYTNWSSVAVHDG